MVELGLNSICKMKINFMSYFIQLLYERHLTFKIPLNIGRSEILFKTRLI